MTNAISMRSTTSTTVPSDNLAILPVLRVASRRTFTRLLLILALARG
ncbi:MAG: hypothetical protein H2674_16635 [Limnospira indica BM01]|nr:MAG: hypothetical protein H2674_16635 [Limnospira indica BM01]